MLNENDGQVVHQSKEIPEIDTIKMTLRKYNKQNDYQGESPVKVQPKSITIKMTEGSITIRSTSAEQKVCGISS